MMEGLLVSGCTLCSARFSSEVINEAIERTKYELVDCILRLCLNMETTETGLAAERGRARLLKAHLERLEGFLKGECDGYFC